MVWDGASVKSSSLNTHGSDLTSSLIKQPKKTLTEKYPKTFTTLKVVGIGVQIGAVGYSGWASGSIFGDPLRSNNAPNSAEDYTTLSFTTVLLVASIASLIFRGCKRRVNHYRFADYFANPLLVVGAYLVGTAILSSQNAMEADSIWNTTYSQNLQIFNQNHASKMNFKYQVRFCNYEFAMLGNAFTRPRCSLCPAAGTTSTGLTSWGTYTEVDQIDNDMEYKVLQYSIVPVNQTVCKPEDPLINSLWPDFASFSANETLGEWPCNPNMTAITSNQTGAATAVIMKAMLMLEPPFVVELEPTPNRTLCYQVTGFGSRTFNFGEVCKFSDVILKEIPKEYQTCLTEHFYEHARNYTAKYVPYVELPKLNYPGRVSKFHDEGYTQQNDIFYGTVGAISMFLGFVYELRYYTHEAYKERKALLVNARV